ncbi:MAG: recombinase family protein, partial [Ignavibacteria bacterium]|nr:recombinase family protein [Ignavibacteria bacterium]
MNKPISGAVPFGYNYDKLGRTINTDEVERKIVRMIFELYLDGKGVNLIANELNKAELFGRRTHRWASATISNILSSDRLRFYRGYDQNGIRGNWESLLTEDEYRFISDKREKNKSKKPSLKKEEKEKYLLTSIGV